MDELFHKDGREGRNEDAAAFNRAVDRMAEEFGWSVLRRRSDVRKPTGGDSRGLDSLILVPNPQTGEGEAWVREEKRHKKASDCSPACLAGEVQAIRDKAADLDRPGLYEDAELGSFVTCVRGGMLFQHTRGWARVERRRVNAEAANALKHHQLRARPYVIYEFGPDVLCALGEMFERVAPAEFWWPPVERQATWSSVCPPGQLAVGWLLYRDADGHSVLWCREDLERDDARAVARFAHRAGERIDRVICNGLTESDIRYLADSWRLEAKSAEQQGRPAVPSRAEGLELDVDRMRAFERRWGASSASAGSARPGRRVIALAPAAHQEVPPLRRGRLEVAYPAPPMMARTAVTRGTLHGLQRLLAGEGVFTFAGTIEGAAAHLEEIWLAPPAYRRLGRHLETTPHASILGFELQRGDAQTLPQVGEDRAFDELIRRVEATAGRVVDAEHHVTLRCVDDGIGSWTVRFELVYRRLVDIEGGDRIRAEVPVTLLARPSDGDGVDLAVLVEQSRDVQAATSWLHAALRLSQAGWSIRQQSLPRTEPARFRVLRTILEELGGPNLVVRAQDQHRREGPRDLTDRFARGVRTARYETDFYDLDTIAERAERELLFNSRVIAYLPYRGDSGEAVLSIKARQRPTDAHLSLTWDGGRRVTSGAPRLAVYEDWQRLETLGWPESQKREALATLWGKAVRVLRSEAAATADALRRTA